MIVTEVGKGIWGRQDTRTGIHYCILKVSSIAIEPWKPLGCNIPMQGTREAVFFAIQWKSRWSLPHTGVSPWLPSTHSKFRNLCLGHCLSEDFSSLSWVSLIFPLYSLLLPVLSPNNSPSLLSEILASFKRNTWCWAKMPSPFLSKLRRAGEF